MKILVAVLCLLLPVMASAQNPNMQGVDMTKMMEVMQEMQQCMAKVDQQELRALEAEAEKMEAELKSLCEQGKRDQAQKKALAYSKKVMKNPALIQMKECGELTKGMMPPGSEEPSLDEEFDYTNRHVCDE